MCTFISVWFSCANFRTGHGRAARMIPGARTCAQYPRCELLVSQHPELLAYECYNCMQQRQAVRRDNLFAAMQQVQMPLPGIPERLVPALAEGPEPEPERAGLPMAEEGMPEEGEPAPEGREFVYRRLI
jgi:hypothetical protein